MAQPPKGTILDHFDDLDDPRVERTRRHNLVDIIAIAICATICGADSWVHIELFGRSKLEWFQTFLELPGGTSHPTTPSAMSSPGWTQCSCRTASCPGPKPSQNCCRVKWWLLTGRRPGGPTMGLEQGLPYLVSAWATQNALTLGQVKTEEKSNEITAIPQLLEMLDLHGCIVTIDAMGCQRESPRRLQKAGPTTCWR